jgi:D-glycero-alpha-D-manno-heptose-7-phosphate kinase
MPRNKKVPVSVTAQAPCRVDLAGGTVDMWPLYLFHPGAVVVNIAVEVMTHCRVTAIPEGIELLSHDTGAAERFRSMAELRQAARPAHALGAQLLKYFYSEGEGFAGEPTGGGLRLETDSESPAGAGISGSSALMIAATAALARFTGRRMGLEEIRGLAQNIEAQLIRVPTGCQDYYPALYGGASAIELSPAGIRREAIPCDAAELEHRFVLIYTGAPRQSGINNWEVFKRHVDGDRRIHRNFDRIVEIARAMREALAVADWSETGRLLREEWKLRRTNSPGISTPEIDRLIALAQRNGAVGAKACGAGGGGCVLFMTAPEARERVAEKLVAAGAQRLPFTVARRGVKVSASRG